MENDNSKLKYYFYHLFDFFFLFGISILLFFIITDAFEHKFNLNFIFSHLVVDDYDFPYSYLYADGLQFFAGVIVFILILISIIIWYRKRAERIVGFKMTRKTHFVFLLILPIIIFLMVLLWVLI